MNQDLSTLLALDTQHTIRWIVVGKLLDARHRRVIQHAHLVYNASGILHAGTDRPAQALIPGKTNPDAILPFLTALPGLIDAHSHVFLQGGELDAEKRTAYQNQSPDTLLILARERLNTVARQGIVAIRDGGDKDSVGLRLSQQRGKSGSPGMMPDVYSPGPGIHRQGRYGSFFCRPLEDDADIRACVRNRIAAGADHIKVVPTGIINFAKGAVVAQPQFTADELAEITFAAHAQQRQVMAHASGEAGIDVALTGGVDSIEHGFFVSDDQLARMRDQETAWIPTLAPVQVQVDQADRMGWTGDTLVNLRRILDNHAISIQRAMTLGVRVRIGSDAGSYGVPHGLGLFKEMELLEKAGPSPLEILCRATFDNRDLLPGHPPYGSLEPGFKARFVLTAHDPFVSIAELAKPHWVVFDGQVSTSESLNTSAL